MNTNKLSQTITICTLLGLCLFIAYSTPVQAVKIQELDRIIAIANSDVITKSELDKQLKLVSLQLKRNKTKLPPISVLRKQVLERMIVDNLQMQIAKRRGIRVSDETVNRTITKIAKENKLTLDKFRKVLAKDGVKFSEYRKDVKTNILLERLRSQIVDKEVNITKQEVDNYLSKSKKSGGQATEYKLSHIMIAIPEGATPKQIKKRQDKANKILQKLRNGADFGKTAITNSDDQSALKGGKMGWLKAAQMPTLFEEAMRKMKIGGLSQVVRSPSGFHIIKLVNKRKETTKHFITQVLARHILIKPNTVKSDKLVKTKLEGIRQQIVNGEDFAKLAKLHSEDKSSGIDGGNLGWMTPDTFVSEFKDVLNKLEPGKLSEVFKTRFGWHIVQLMSRRKHDNSEEQKRTQVKKQIYKRKANEVLNNWIRRIRDEAYVEYHLNN